MDLAVHSGYKFKKLPSPNNAQDTMSRYLDGSTGGSTSQTPFAWYITGGGSGNKTAQVIERGDPDINKNALKLHVDGGAFVAASLVNNSNTPQDYRDNAIKVKPGTNYKLKYRFMSSLAGGDSTRGAEIEVRVIDADSATTTVKTGVIKESQDWSEKTLDITTANDTAFLEIKIVLYGHEGDADLDMDAYFSNIRLYEAVETERNNV